MGSHLACRSLADVLERLRVEVEHCDMAFELLPPTELDRDWDAALPGDRLPLEDLVDPVDLAQRDAHEVLEALAGTLRASEEQLQLLNAELLLCEDDLNQIKELIDLLAELHRKNFEQVK